MTDKEVVDFAKAREKVINKRKDEREKALEKQFNADSKTADKLKADFNEKIEKATAEMEELKKQLQMLKQI